MIAHEGALHANHIPLYLDPDRGAHGTLIGHVARANSVWPLLPQQAVAVFHGPLEALAATVVGTPVVMAVRAKFTKD